MSCYCSRRGRKLASAVDREGWLSPLCRPGPEEGLHQAQPTLRPTLPASTGCQASSLDLVFVLDASASVGPENFIQMQGFVRSCTLQFDVNPDVTQIGLVVYGSQVQTAFRLDTHVTRAAVLRAVSQAPYLGGAGSAGTALLHVYDKVMTVQRGARPGVPKAVVVLTGGRGAEDAVVPVQKLRDNGISVLVMGVGPVLGEALRRLAGPRDALIHVAAYADLRFHRDALTEWLCGGEWGVRGLRGCLRGQHARLYQGHSSSWLLNAFYVSGSVLNPTSPKPCSRHSQTPLTFRAHKI